MYVCTYFYFHILYNHENKNTVPTNTLRTNENILLYTTCDGQVTFKRLKKQT
ncbi:hypothetical protein Hanom_Chr07g00659841 [Helianthus anomalus]